MKLFRWIMSGIIFLIFTIICTFLLFIITQYYHERLYGRDNYLMWTFNEPYVNLYIIYIVSLSYCLVSLLKRRFRLKWLSLLNSKRKLLVAIVINATIIYGLTTNVTILTDNEIIDYHPLKPMGQRYPYHDVDKINLGASRKGHFYYRITLMNGKTINLNSVGGVKDDQHPFFIIEQLDNSLVQLLVNKQVDSKYLARAELDLAKPYSDSMWRIFNRTTTKD
ncbi:hypothetical protein SAMN04488134_10432 [Amphibacillus marinus]|uniref:Uncharacterized protein n=1 Tax=Amphibacillus marinus TaxID=872970 RepID=A0A1H8M5H7_9BACI|nr:hypothetical protein [Amphibacillus marinus]SEO12396.1 hypothetical protein SAMN04488134_10432 [Amphibacillus marinus]